MMGVHLPKPRLYNEQLDLERRVRANHPLRRVAEAVDFAFVRVEVAHLYGHKGNPSVDPVIVLKLMFLLFYEDIASERELMAMLPERLDYLWFLGYELEEKPPNPSPSLRVISRVPPN